MHGVAILLLHLHFKQDSTVVAIVAARDLAWFLGRWGMSLWVVYVTVVGVFMI